MFAFCDAQTEKGENRNFHTPSNGVEAGEGGTLGKDARQLGVQQETLHKHPIHGCHGSVNLQSDH